MKSKNSATYYRNRMKLQHKQHGAVLIFCLVFLLILTLMGVASMESTILEERMAGNMHDYSVAFQAAESALGAGESWLTGEKIPPASSSDGTTAVWVKDAADPDSANLVPWWQEVSRNNNQWWGDNAIAINGFAELAAPPAYIIEEYASSNEGQSIAEDSEMQLQTQIFYRITARGTGHNDASTVLLQSMFMSPGRQSWRQLQ